MRTIELEVKRDDQVVRTVFYQGPSTWREIEKHHLLELASALSSQQTTGDAKKVLAARLFRIPRQVWLKTLNPKERYRLSLATDFLFARNELHDWVIPVIRSGLRRYYGPKSKLANLVTEEYSMAELCYESFEKTRNPEYLDTLVAILYRPRRWFGINDDIRERMTVQGIEKRAERFKKLPLRVKVAVLLNYEGCRNFIHQRNPDVFKKGTGTGSAPKVTPWAQIIRNGAGGIFGTLAETEKVNIHKFLIELNTRLKEQEAKQQ